MKTEVTLPQASFDCPRTCRHFERRDLCRFSAMFALVGIKTTVNSHTVSVEIEFRNHEALAAAVAHLGGQVLGNGTHRLCSTSETGFGFKLKGWVKPCVAREDGTLAFDDYNGMWGNRKDLDSLKAEYATRGAKAACDQLGWMTEKQADGTLLVYHPDGGTLKVDAHGEIDADGFNGVGCHEAATLLAEGIGKPVQYVAKPEFYQSQVEQTETGN